ncbi:hypothetical protein M3629_03910 [Paenibacillus polysaccharolyticus]|uniref:hypothetical protein n=1 Tax=Paenibacillus polysaccharolyticus TaxID=582692 RepID=UPI00203ABEB9|nr:hypothetical protein [Paenibacillus polysaccharolyticus]MCM3131914.1 hypothetical protein [Paenibacillus polysaccharolyticus]
MAVVAKRLGKGTFGTASATQYTVPVSTTTLVKAITLCNKTASDATVTLLFGGTEVIYQHTIKARDTVTIPFLDQIIQAGETITGLAGTANAINYYISGKEVT